jgi:uncharacterized protein YukJ
MSRINYNCLRGKVHAYAHAAPASNPHLWVILEAGGRLWFATINVRSDKDRPGDPAGKAFLYYLIDTDFRHPVAASILARPQGMSPVGRDYRSGAIDYQRGNLFDPTAMRVLPMDAAGDDNLANRLSATLELAKTGGCEVFFYGNAFSKDNPHQTDAAFGYTPDTPFGIDNVHMTQGDPQSINAHIRENGIWHDGACFIWDENARRMTAAFLSFQSQSWHTNSSGDLLYGVTGCEAPQYDFSSGAPVALPVPKRAAELTSLHRAPDGTGTLVLTNMTTASLDLSGWSVLSQAKQSLPIPPVPLASGQPLTIPLPAGALDDRGGILTLANAAGLRVDSVAYLGGDSSSGWSTAF